MVTAQPNELLTGTKILLKESIQSRYSQRNDSIMTSRGLDQVLQMKSYLLRRQFHSLWMLSADRLQQETTSYLLRLITERWPEVPGFPASAGPPGLQHLSCFPTTHLPGKEVSLVKSVLATSFKNPPSLLAGTNMNLFCFASSDKMKGYFSLAIYSPTTLTEHCKAVIGFLLFTTFLHNTYFYSLGLYFWHRTKTHSTLI